MTEKKIKELANYMITLEKMKSNYKEALNYLDKLIDRVLKNKDDEFDLLSVLLALKTILELDKN